MRAFDDNVGPDGVLGYDGLGYVKDKAADSWL